MSKYWYLVSSLPYLRFGEKAPMAAGAFRAACAGHLSDGDSAVVEAALENREPPPGVAARYWNREVQLRDAVIRVRAKARGVDAAPFLKPYGGFSVAIEKMVTDAFTRPDPLEQEMEFDRIRWASADELALADPFGFPGILAFAIKVRIAERWVGLDETAGQEKVEELVSISLVEDRGEESDQNN